MTWGVFLLTITQLCLIEINHIQTMEVTVSTGVGSIKGRTRGVSFDGKSKQIVQFLGIPYAEAPIGDLRFVSPVPKGKFKETFDAKEYGLPCPQYVSSTVRVLIKMPKIMSEDCLSLNIFTPSVKGTNTKYGVMLFIHGGGYVNGESGTCDGEMLSSYGDVIVVTINYRLGALGFLSMEDEDVPGNAGLWDQHLAIKWVKDHINNFGGDASKITVFGESAGSASTGFQTIYGGNSGMFQRAILESGSANALWTIQPGGYFNSAKMLALKLDCEIPESDGASEILKCLRSAQNFTEIAMHAQFLKWTPRVDEDFVTSEALASIKWPSNGDHVGIFKDFDVMIGTNGFEGHYFMKYMLTNLTSQLLVAPKPVAKSIFKAYMKALMGMIFYPNVDVITEAILFQYSDAENPNDRHFLLKQLNDIVTDTWFFIPAFKDVSVHSHMNTVTKTYQYEFNHKWPYPLPEDEWLDGASHSHELAYVFGLTTSIRILYNFTKEQVLHEWPTSKIVMDYWTNFAKSGDPIKPRVVPTMWTQYSTSNQDYLHFPVTGRPESKQFLNAKRRVFWMEYVPKVIEQHARCDASSLNNLLHCKGYIVLYIFTLFYFL